MTLLDLFTALRRAPTPRAASSASRAHYEYCTLWVLRIALGARLCEPQPPEITGLPATILSKSTAEKFFAVIEHRAAELPDQAARARYLRSAYSMHSNAVNLVSARACEAIRRQSPPDFRDWREGRKLFGRPLPAAPRAPLPSDAIIRCTLSAWVDLARQGAMPSPASSLSSLHRRNLFIAVGLQLACGLRAGETAQARWGWWQAENKRPLLATSEVRVKNQTGALEVVPVDPFWRVLNFWVDRHGWRGAPDAYCLATRTSETVKQGNLTFRRATENAERGARNAELEDVCSALRVPHSAFECVTDRTYWPARHVSEWLRALGWRTQKTNHALRDYSASLITMRFGLGCAKDWCRHSQQKTTERSYNRFVSGPRRSSPETLRWVKWASKTFNAEAGGRKPEAGGSPSSVLRSPSALDVEC